MKLVVKDNASGPVQLLAFHVDVELCGLFVALYRYSCKNACWIVPNDLVKIAKDFGLLYDVSTNDTNPPGTPISGKATSIIAILGISGWLFYRWYKTKKSPKYTKLKSLADYNEGIRARFSLFGRPSHVKSSYFGPKNPPEYKEENKSHYKPVNNRYNQQGRNAARDMMSSDSDWSPIHFKEHKSRRSRKRSYRGWPLFSKKSYNYDEWSNSRESADQSINSSPSHPLWLKREESLDSICSDFSMASVDIPANIDSNVTAKMDQLQEEIEQLKTSCMSMDEDFETIKTNRNLPGLSNLMSSNDSDALETKESAKACFKGLYSLTTINRSMSFDFSMSQCGSIDEDSPYNILSPTGESSLEWDSLDTQEMHTPTWTCDEPSSAFEKLEHSSVNINKVGTVPIGPLMSLSSYSDGSNNSVLPHHVLKSLLDISTKKYNFVGYIQEDSSNLIRATLFVMLCKNLALPNSNVATSIIKEAYYSNPSLFHCWSFNNLNSYSSNKMKGVTCCLNSLDKLVSGIRTSDNIPDLLTLKLNTDPVLDSHIVEAFKLHIAAKIFSSEILVDSFYRKYCPLLSKDLSLLDRIEILINFTNGCNSSWDSGSIIGSSNVAIIDLISHTFGVVIEVLKPSAFDTDNYSQKYPQTAPDNWPSILLLSEDNKHFQIVI